MALALVIYDGPALSGRSEALRKFAWSEPTPDLIGTGQYLHPHLRSNLCGFASTVRGELYCHGLLERLCAGKDAEMLHRLLDGLPPMQRIHTLSGGELGRLTLACAIGARPQKLGLDLSLEPLDGRTRVAVMQDVLKPLASRTAIHVVDSHPEEIEGHFDCRKTFTASAGAPQLGESLIEFCREGPDAEVEAPSLAIEGLSFTYPRSRRLIFENASMCFAPGRPYLLCAPNGAGKTTLARLLLGVVKANSGVLRVRGETFRPWRDFRNLFFCTFQNPAYQLMGANPADYLTRIAAAAAARPTWLRGSPGVDATEIVRRFGLTPYTTAEMFELPLIVKRWLSLAAALLSRAPWLFLDEPSMGLDRSARQGLCTLIETLCQRGYGVIVVTHSSDFDGLGNVERFTIADGRLAGGAQKATG